MAGLTLAEARKALEAAEAKAVEMGVALSLSVVDARGDLVCMVRMDGAPWRTAPVSRAKARASAAFGVPSRDLQARADTPVMRSLVMMEGGDLIPGTGAVPIIRNGVCVGAIGGSGGTADQDEMAAQAGVAAIR